MREPETGQSHQGLPYVYSTVQVNSSDESDSGNYVCTAVNHMGLKNNESVFIEVSGNNALFY